MTLIDAIVDDYEGEDPWSYKDEIERSYLNILNELDEQGD